MRKILFTVGTDRFGNHLITLEDLSTFDDFGLPVIFCQTDNMADAFKNLESFISHMDKEAENEQERIGIQH